MGNFVFHADFVIPDMAEDWEVSLILRRPFFDIAKALVDMSDGVITLRVGNQIVKLDVRKKKVKQNETMDGIELQLEKTFKLCHKKGYEALPVKVS